MPLCVCVHHPVCLVPTEARCWIPWDWSSRWLWAMRSAVLVGGIITRGPHLRLSCCKCFRPSFQESILSAHSSCSNVLGIYRDLTQESSRLDDHSSWYLVSSWRIPQGHDEEIKMDDKEKLLEGLRQSYSLNFKGKAKLCVSIPLMYLELRTKHPLLTSSVSPL